MGGGSPKEKQAKVEQKDEKQSAASSAASRAKAVDKWKRKKWYTILAPSDFDRVEIGETVAVKDGVLMGRTIHTTLDVLTGQRTLRHIDLKFKVTEVNGLKANTECVGHDIKESYLSRLVRRRKSKIDVSITVATKDGKNIRVAAMTLTAKKAKRTKEKLVRKAMIDEINKCAQQNNFDAMLKEMLLGELVMKIAKRAQEFAPIKRVEITKSAVLK